MALRLEASMALASLNLVHLQHVLEELEIVVVEFQSVACLQDDAMADEEAQLVLVAVEGVYGIVVADGERLALVEHVHKPSPRPQGGLPHSHHRRR